MLILQCDVIYFGRQVASAKFLSKFGICLPDQATSRGRKTSIKAPNRSETDTRCRYVTMKWVKLI